MKILMVSSLYGATGGGAGRIASYIARGLSQSGHQVSIVTMGEKRYPALVEEQGARFFRFRPVNLYPFEEKDQHPAWQKLIWQVLDIYNFHCASVFRKILLDEVPDIIHIHKMRGFSGAVWSVATQMFPGRVVQTCHDYESMSPDGLLRGSIGKMTLRRQWPLRGYQLLRSKLSAGISSVTAPSAHTLKRIKDSGMFPFAWSKVIANTHGWSQGKLQSLHQKAEVQGNTRFLFLSRLEREKGIVELCEAFLLACRLDSSLHLDIAGWGTLDLMLREKYARCPNIHFLGVVDGLEKETILNKADIVVVPSLVEEVFGLVTIEAFAFGKPVIASNIGGIPELVRHGETGWLVEPGNVQALADCLTVVSQMGASLLMKMRQNCREYSYSFSLEEILLKYLNIYQQVMN